LNIKTLKWTRFATYVSGGGLAAVFSVLALIDQKNSQVILGLGVALVAIAGAVGSLIPSPATAVVDNAVTTTPGGTPTGNTIDSSPPVIK